MNETINREYVGLPQKYWSKQNFCWYIHDIILSIFKDCIEDDKINTKIVFKNEAQAQEFEKSEDIIEWLYDNNYKKEANLILGKKIFHAILADMCNFIYESLNTIEKGKITVSLALLRKPFRDNLLYLEWLLGMPKEFIKMVYEQNIDKYAVENISKEKKINIIKSAMTHIENREFFNRMNEKVYYDLRYNYYAGNSLQRVWNNANHLVTTGKHIRSNEFNFVFMNKEIHLDYLEYYYNQVPHLLFYTYNIILELYNIFIRKVSNSTRLYNNGLIIYKLNDMLDSIKPEEYFTKETEVLLRFPCEKCEKIIKVDIDSEEFKGFKNGWGFKCTQCKNDINTCKYVFLEDYQDKKKYLKLIK